MKDIRQALFSIFQAEHAQHLEQIRSILGLYKTVSEAEGKAMLDEAFRRAHTLKGAARAVDIRAVEELANGMESVLSRVREGGLPLDREVAGVIHQALDSSEECLVAVEQQRTPAVPAGALRAMAQLLGPENARRYRSEGAAATGGARGPGRRHQCRRRLAHSSRWSACRARIWIGWFVRPDRCSRRVRARRR